MIFHIDSAIESQHIQFVAISRVVFKLRDASKQRAITFFNGGLSYRGVHFHVDGGIRRSGALFLNGGICHGGKIVR